MVRLLGSLIYGIGWVVGDIKWRLGIPSRIPKKYRR